MREREVKEAALRADIDRLQAEAARLLAARHLSLLFNACRLKM
jgi:hypothetical protein